MNDNVARAAQELTRAIDRFLETGEVSPLPAQAPPELSQLQARVASLLAHASHSSEEYHRVNMNMATALTDWYEVLKRAKAGDLDARATGPYEDEFLDRLGEMLNQTLASLKQLNEESFRVRQELIEQQSKVIQELSTPIIQVWDRVLALPVIGVVDSVRAMQMMETLLTRVVDTQARCVILDLTGVSVIDTKTADYLVKMIKAGRLVGARSIVTGIGPEVAQTITRMGLELPDIVTVRDLRAGLKHAFKVLGYRVLRKKKKGAGGEDDD